jgi:hypothetical protein
MDGGHANDMQYFADGGDPDRHIPSNDEWMHHAVVKDADMLTYYRDGAPLNDFELIDPMYSPDPLPFAMGGQHGVETWMGHLSDVRLYTSAATEAEIQAIMEGVVEPGQQPLQAGDADMDCDFDQLDLVLVQQGGKYLLDQDASWSEGDWNGAPGGSVADQDPPPGDGRFNQMDIIAALGSNLYLQGSYCDDAGLAALAGPGEENDGQTDLVYDAASGALSVDPPEGGMLTSINIDSTAGKFIGDKPAALDGSFDTFSEGNIFKATFGEEFGAISFGNVLPAGLSGQEVIDDLTVIGSLAGGGGLGDVGLVYIPEPSTIMLLGFGLALMAIQRRR